MCGIAGYFGEFTREHGNTILNQMADSMHHRGPDSGGVLISENGNVGLANRRLSIIDTSDRGRQPISSRDRCVSITFNGEIYNFQDLRDSLTKRGHKFTSSSDTEVVLHLYQEFGLDFVGMLRGMFAVAISDEKLGRLILARDPLGIKPLYTFRHSGGLLFGSELKTLLSTGMIPRTPDSTAFAGYLQLGYVPQPLTAVEGISSFPTGTMAVVDRDGIRTEKFWNFPTPDESDRRSRDQVVGELKEVLHDSIKSHLISDVPLGIFLSGGIDSNSLVSIAKHAGSENLRTYSLGFSEPRYDEAHLARLSAEMFGTDHQETYISSGDVGRSLDRIIRSMDQPTIDGINTYMVTQAAVQSGLKVAFSGVGGDELFYGYPSFNRVPKYLRATQIARYLPGSEPLARAFSDKFSGTKNRFLEMFGSKPTISNAYKTVRSINSMSVASRISSKAQFDTEGYFDSLIPESDPDMLQLVSVLELSGYMGNQLLRDTDCMSMAHSMEVRVPLLDTELVDFVLKVPSRFKAFGGQKQLLLDALPERLPEHVTNRDKTTFTFPMDHWIRDEWAEEISDTLHNANGVSMFDGKSVAELHASFLRGELHWSSLWSVFVALRWTENLKSSGLNS